MSRPGPQHCGRSTQDSDSLLTPLYILQHPRSRDGRLARLAVATSRDLVHWEKRGLVFANSQRGRYKDIWSKSGAIICRRAGDHLIAARIDGLSWMYWGEADIYIATSDNLIDWEPLVGGGALRCLFGPRRNRFDSALVEPGPPAVLTDAGILFIYNSKNSRATGDVTLPARCSATRTTRLRCCAARQAISCTRATIRDHRPDRQRLLPGGAGAFQGPLAALLRDGRFADRGGQRPRESSVKGHKMTMEAN